MSTVPPSEQPGEDQPSISDEQLEAFLREAAEGGGAGAPKEPSARARMVARRLREDDEAARAGRTGRWGRKPAGPPQPAEPPGWRTGPTWEETHGRARRRRRLGAVVGVLLTVALAVVAIRPSLLLDHLPGGDEGPSSAASPVAPASGGGPTLDAPFRGSPARSWAEGADAIELPAAKAVGDMSKDQVEQALRRTKDFLVAANLDPAVRRGGQPAEALSLLDPKQPDMLADARRSLRSPDRDHDPVNLFSRFDPDEVRPVGDVVKVRGRMTYEAGKRGQVRVRADYTFVYPMTSADSGADRISRTIVRRELTMLLSDPSRWTITPGKLQVERYDSAFFNVACENDGGWLHPSFPTAAPTATPPTGEAHDPYDLETPLGEVFEGGDCGTVTRS
ncbi:hypothetical protein ACWC10_09385 [Streptomyces sp. NPDC001595]|uniref:hypothetical protein n=1 Tax=Streptomyces sp. NPDC001532 TaxID=3154520 RepID=UPI00332B6620